MKVLVEPFAGLGFHPLGPERQQTLRAQPVHAPVERQVPALRLGHKRPIKAQATALIADLQTAQFQAKRVEAEFKVDIRLIQGHRLGVDFRRIGAQIA